MSEEVGMKIWPVERPEDLKLVAEILGRNNRRDFSFLAQYQGKVRRWTCEHQRGGDVADIRPARMYGQEVQR